ncbi:MAG: TerC/Alx family metal homeostasis membrane protein [Tepidisphaeraceae bacterium]
MIWFWIGFLVLIALFLAMDLGVFHKQSREVSLREALTWSGVWFVTSLLFSVFVYFAYANHWQGLGEASELTGAGATRTYLVAYLLEWSLSVDNLFVIALIFKYFAVPSRYQHRVLFWGIIAAVVLRGAFILVGNAALSHFSWLMYPLAIVLLVIAWKMLRSDEEFNVADSKVVKWVYARFRVTSEIHGDHFIAHIAEPHTGTVKRWLTPLAVTLIVVNVIDLIFAIDSIPAAFGLFVGRKPDAFLIFTSNIFAVMGLRSMYFALASLMGKFAYLQTSLAIILMFIGFKMLIEPFVHGPQWLEDAMEWVTFPFVIVVLGGGVIASIVHAKRHPEEALAENWP